MRSKSLRATTSSHRDDRQMDISGPLDYSPDHVGNHASGRVTKQMDSLDLSQHIIHRLSDRHTIHHNHNNQSQRFSNKSLDKTSSGSIDNFNHLFKKSISEGLFRTIKCCQIDSYIELELLPLKTRF